MFSPRTARPEAAKRARETADNLRSKENWSGLKACETVAIETDKVWEHQLARTISRLELFTYTKAHLAAEL